MNSGFFITLEGGEGTGKSTLARGLQDALLKEGHDVILTREPGGAKGADAIRDLVVKRDVEEWAALEEALLFTAARANHLRQTIRPALARGALVICDRYIDSTYAYQVVAGGLDPSAFTTLHQLIDAPKPDLTIVLDLALEQSLRRATDALFEGRFEMKESGFHQKVRAAFVDIAKREPERCTLLDAAMTPAKLRDEAHKLIKARLRARTKTVP